MSSETPKTPTLSLPCLEIGAARDEAEFSVILMHGLGADASDFADVAEMFCATSQPRRWRFVLPNAPVQPVTINMGMRMPAWYDIFDLSQPRAVNWATVTDSARALEALVARESARKVVLAGFSQGAAMALHVGLRHQERIAGVLLMSGYLLEGEDQACPPKSDSKNLPVAIFHGSADPVVTADAATAAVEVLEKNGYAPSLKIYPGLEHSVSDEELRDVFDWLEALSREATGTT